VFRAAARPPPAPAVRAVPAAPPPSPAVPARAASPQALVPPQMGLGDVLMLASLGVSGGGAPDAPGAGAHLEPPSFGAAGAQRGFLGAPPMP